MKNILAVDVGFAEAGHSLRRGEIPCVCVRVCGVCECVCVVGVDQGFSRFRSTRGSPPLQYTSTLARPLPLPTEQQFRRRHVPEVQCIDDWAVLAHIHSELSKGFYSL